MGDSKPNFMDDQKLVEYINNQNELNSDFRTLFSKNDDRHNKNIRLIEAILSDYAYFVSDLTKEDPNVVIKRVTDASDYYGTQDSGPDLKILD